MAAQLTKVNSAAGRWFDLDQQSVTFLRLDNGYARHDVPGHIRENKMKAIGVLALAAGVAAVPAAHAQSVDVSAAEALLKKSGCMKCHSVSAKKEGPSFRETAAKYKGKPDAAATLYQHLTGNPKIKVDGKEELHDALKTKNDADIKNVVAYILSR
jgi:cytochrome c